MKRLIGRTTIVGLAASAVLAMPGPASAMPCPPGTNNPLYCAHLEKQVEQIEKSTLEILASYKSIRTSAISLNKKVKGAAMRKQVETLLAKAQRHVDLVKRLLKQAKTQSHNVYLARATVAKARREAALARVFAAEARVIAAIQVVTGG